MILINLNSVTRQRRLLACNVCTVNSVKLD